MKISTTTGPFLRWGDDNAILKLLKDGGAVVQKTDNRDFFDFSLEEYQAAGFNLTELTFNLHENGNPEWNIVTEYEQKWVEMGLPIHRVVAKK